MDRAVIPDILADNGADKNICQRIALLSFRREVIVGSLMEKQLDKGDCVSEDKGGVNDAHKGEQDRRAAELCQGNCNEEEDDIGRENVKPDGAEPGFER